MKPNREFLLPANYRMFAVAENDESVTPGMHQCEGLLAEFVRKFRPGHGQMKSVLSETDRAAKPSVILSAPNVELTDEQTEEIARVTQQRCLEDDPLRRRRYALIIHAKYAFIIGGYDFDRKSKTRSQPQQDFVYEIEKKTYRAIPTVPAPGRVTFGVAPSERYVMIIGGQTYDNKALSSVYLLDTQDIDGGWQKFPSYPHPILAPGVAFVDNRVVVVGGYDIILGETEMLASHYQMDIDEKVWHQCADSNPPRARTLIFDMHNEGTQDVCGGYTVVDGKAQVVDKVYVHNAKKNKWSKLTDIPQFGMNHSLTVAQAKLIVSEEVSDPNDRDHSSTRPIRSYDFESGKWNDMNDDKDRR